MTERLSAIEVRVVEPVGMARIRYEVRERGGATICWAMLDEGGLLITSRGPRAEIDYWQRLDPEEWERELGGLASYDGLLEAVRREGERG